MRMIIKARIGDIERVDGDFKQVGLSLSERRDLVHDVQHDLVNAQTNTVIEASTQCRHCHAGLSIKSMHTIQYKTVYGKVTIDSPHLRRCKCKRSNGVASYSPLAQAIPFRMSPELEYLQVKWAAHLPYAAVTKLLKEILPLDRAISTAGVQNRIRAVGQELDDQVESAIRGERTYPSSRGKKPKITAIAVDSAWLRQRPSRQQQDEAKLAEYFPSKRLPSTGRHVNIIAGRAVREDDTTRVYGYVNKEVTSAATRLDHFLSEQRVAKDEKITIVSDGAAEYSIFC